MRGSGRGRVRKSNVFSINFPYKQSHLIRLNTEKCQEYILLLSFFFQISCSKESHSWMLILLVLVIVIPLTPFKKIPYKLSININVFIVIYFALFSFFLFYRWMHLVNGVRLGACVSLSLWCYFTFHFLVIITAKL